MLFRPSAAISVGPSGLHQVVRAVPGGTVAEVNEVVGARLVDPLLEFLRKILTKVELGQTLPLLIPDCQILVKCLRYFHAFDRYERQMLAKLELTVDRMLDKRQPNVANALPKKHLTLFYFFQHQWAM